MNKFFRILIVVFFSYYQSFAQKTIEVKHTYYTMTYEVTQYAEIVGYYVQTKEHALISLDKNHKIDRSTIGSFKQDPDIDPKYQVANDKEYSSWNKAHPDDPMDKGHVNPYSAFDFDETAAKESMYYTNTCPQSKYFNEHQWEAVEQYVLRTVAPTYGDVQVWTGVLISKSHPKTMNDVPKPDYYWKLIKYQKDGQETTEAWLGVNDKSNHSTDPDAIKDDPVHLRKVIKQYYPNLTVAF